MKQHFLARRGNELGVWAFHDDVKKLLLMIRLLWKQGVGGSCGKKEQNTIRPIAAFLLV